MRANTTKISASRFLYLGENDYPPSNYYQVLYPVAVSQKIWLQSAMRKVGGHVGTGIGLGHNEARAGAHRPTKEVGAAVQSVKDRPPIDRGSGQPSVSFSVSYGREGGANTAGTRTDMLLLGP